MLQRGKWNLAQLYEVHQCSGLNATLTNIVPRINSEATQGKQPLVWVEAVSSSVTSYFHLADRQNICQGGCSSALYSFVFCFFNCQLQLLIRKKQPYTKHAGSTVDSVMPLLLLLTLSLIHCCYLIC